MADESGGRIGRVGPARHPEERDKLLGQLGVMLLEDAAIIESLLGPGRAMGVHFRRLALVELFRHPLVHDALHDLKQRLLLRRHSVALIRDSSLTIT